MPALIRVVGIVAVYVVASGSFFYINDRASGASLEFPWTFYWALWGTLFSPPIGMIIFDSCDTTVDPKRLRRACIANLIIVLGTMATSFRLDLYFRTVAIVLVALCIGCHWLFRMSTR